MISAADLRMHARYASSVPRFLMRGRMSVAQARAIIRERLATREQNFLRMVERGVYDNPRSPYLPLLRLARCELGDIRRMVRDRGLDETLCALHAAGVYVTFEEFKGRVPIVRDGREFHVGAHDFDSPFVRGHFATSSGGSTGVGTRTTQDLNHLAATTPQYAVTYDAHGVSGAPVGIWQPVLPCGTGIALILRGALLGNVPRVWFSPVMSGDLRPELKFRAATWYVVSVARMFGVRAPRPRHVPLDRAVVMARWAADTARAEGSCLVRAPVSMALRIAIAAREHGIDLTGVTLMGGGEPPTDAKVRGITQGGARYIPTYVFVESGPVGMGCCAPQDGNDVHFCKDALALIQRPQPVPGTDFTVDAFCFTSLLPTAPKLLLNVLSDDFGVIERNRSCGCPLEDVGYTEHLRHIRSYRKLTGEGVTLIGSDMVRILEDVLPARFGGTPLDYQLSEEEDAQGFTRLSLVVSPRVPLPDDQAVVDVVLAELSRGKDGADSARAFWKQASTLRVRRADPVWTGRGKLMSLHFAKKA